MPRMLAQANRKLLWIPDGGIDDIAAPTVAELTAAGVIDLSCLVSKQNFAFGPTGDDEINDSPLCFAGNATAPGNTNYSDEMDFYRYTVALEDIPWDTFTGKGIEGLLALRIGPPYEQVVAAADEFQVHEVITGTPTPNQVAEQAGYEKFRQKFHVQNAEDRAVVVAGP